MIDEPRRRIIIIKRRCISKKKPNLISRILQKLHKKDDKI
jgi:hypothetical protein